MHVYLYLTFTLLKEDTVLGTHYTHKLLHRRVDMLMVDSPMVINTWVSIVVQNAPFIIFITKNFKSMTFHCSVELSVYLYLFTDLFVCNGKRRYKQWPALLDWYFSFFYSTFFTVAKITIFYN